MEFEFNASKVLECDNEGFSIIDCRSLKRVVIPQFSNRFNYQPNIAMKSQNEQNLQQIIDSMGKNSAIAQQLKQVITTYQKCHSENQFLYFKAQKNLVQGFLKIGYRKLFYHNQFGKMIELTPLCLLDFYVHENVQRGGIGKQLFEKMLSHQKVQPSMMAYDRPSPKLIGFMKKHYNLSSYIPQNNNYVIFDQYFTNSTSNTAISIKNSSSNLKKYGQNILTDNSQRDPFGYKKTSIQNIIQSDRKDDKYIQLPQINQKNEDLGFRIRKNQAQRNNRQIIF